jgi:hypothetical protein
LGNGGERVTLNIRGGIVDDLDCSAGWFAGDNGTKSSMERKDPLGATNDPSNWATNNGVVKNGIDREDDPINGTPGQRNSANYPTPTPTTTLTPTPTTTPTPPPLYVMDETGSCPGDGTLENPFCSIQLAVAEASDGDVIEVLCNESADNVFEENVLISGKAIELRSASGPSAVTIQGTGDGSVVTLDNSNSTIQGFTITGGDATYGGGIYAEDSTCVISSCVVKVNSAYRGGGIYATVSSASSLERVTLEDTVIEQNSAASGGAVYGRYARMLVKNCLIVGNSSSSYGAGINNYAAKLSVLSTTIADNISPKKGAGIYCAGCYCCSSFLSPYACSRRCLCCLLSVSRYPCCCKYGYSLTVKNSNIWNNGTLPIYAPTGGCCPKPRLTFDQVTVSTLVPAGSGSTDGLVFRNDGPRDGGVIKVSDFRDGGDLPQPGVKLKSCYKCCCCCGTRDVTYTNVEGGFAGEGNIDAEPLFVTGLQGDYYLSNEGLSGDQVETSPCVDAGDPDSVLVVGTTRTDEINDFGVIDMGYHYPGRTGGGAIVINEIYYAADSGHINPLLGFEYAELYNRSSAPVLVDGWVLRDETGGILAEITAGTSASPIVMPGGSFLVVSSVVASTAAGLQNDLDFSGDNKGLFISGIWTEHDLVNTGDTLVLSMNESTAATALVDFVSFDQDGLEDDPAVDDIAVERGMWCDGVAIDTASSSSAVGRAIHLIVDGANPNGALCQPDLDWAQYPADLGGSPGEPNDIYPEPTVTPTPTNTPTVTPTFQPKPDGIVINEVQYDPSHEGDDELEWVEIHNSSGEAVDLAGFSLRRSGSGTAYRFPESPNSVIASGAYIVVHTNATEGSDTSTDLYGNFGNMSDSAGSVSLFTTEPPHADTIVDFVQYGAGNQTWEPTAQAAGMWPADDYVGTYGGNWVPDAETTHSIGRYPNATDTDIPEDWIEFLVTTAGAANAILPTPTPSPTPTGPTPTPTATGTATPTATPTPTPVDVNQGDIRFNEIAWMGTSGARSADEWFELYNTTAEDIPVYGMVIMEVTVATQPERICSLSGVIPAGGYYLVERNADGLTTSVAENLAVTFGTSLGNSGEDLELVAGETVVDKVYAATYGGWFAGEASPGYQSMEKLHPALPSDNPNSWATYSGTPDPGITNRDGLPINGTPGYQNSVVLAESGDVVINEVAWMGTYASADEWIELHNLSDTEVDIASWSIEGLDTGQVINVSAMAVATGETTVIPAGGYIVIGDSFDMFTSGAQVTLATSAIGMNNSGEGLQLVLYDAPDATGNVIDTVSDGAGPWPAGDSSVETRTTMERIVPGLSGARGNWSNFSGTPFAYDDSETPKLINGSPGQANSVTP